MSDIFGTCFCYNVLQTTESGICSRITLYVNTQTGLSTSDSDKQTRGAGSHYIFQGINAFQCSAMIAIAMGKVLQS